MGGVIPVQTSQLIDTPATRAYLPLVPVLGSLEDPEWAAFLDIEHLAATRGPIGQTIWPVMLPDSPRGELFSQRVEQLHMSGQAGAYTRWLRDNGIIRQCPPWCISTDHPRAAIWDPDRDTEHIAFTAEVPTTEMPHRNGAVTVQVSTFQDLPPQVWVYDAEILTGSEARQLAAVLAEAADVLATIEAPAGDAH